MGELLFEQSSSMEFMPAITQGGAADCFGRHQAGRRRHFQFVSPNERSLPRSFVSNPPDFPSSVQDTIRSDVGKAGMPDSQRQMFLDFKSNEKLGDPMVVGAKIAQISLTCPKELSGQIVDHTDERFN